MLRRVILWTVVILIIFWIATDPQSAAHTANHAWHGFKDFMGSAANFLSRLRF
jgi:hypothetical protein